jgi:hypothetical protein
VPNEEDCAVEFAGPVVAAVTIDRGTRAVIFAGGAAADNGLTSRIAATGVVSGQRVKASEV